MDESKTEFGTAAGTHGEQGREGPGPRGIEHRRALARRLLESINELSVALALPICHRKIEVESPMLEIWGESAVGHDGLRRWFGGLSRVFAFVDVQCVGGEVAGHVLLGEVRVRARGIASRSELRWPAHVAVIFGGERRFGSERIVALGVYLSEAEARLAIQRYEASGTITSHRSRAKAARTSSMRSAAPTPAIAPLEPA